MSTIGFIGPGTMGAPMARNLLAAGHDLVFFARRAAVAAEFTAAGARRAASPAEVARAAEFVVSIVTADDEVREVALGPGGILEGLDGGAGEGKTYLEMSTIGPDTARSVGAALAQRGMQMLDAPVSGGPSGAKAGTLTIMAGGARAVFERSLPVLEAMGERERIFHVGPLGAGQTVKLINQMVGGAIMTLVGEAFALGEAAGVDLRQLADVMAVSSGKSAILLSRGKFVLEDNYEPAFTTALMHKDVMLAVELGRAHNVPLPVATAALQQYRAAVAQGLAGEDFAVVAKVARRAAGRQ